MKLRVSAVQYHLHTISSFEEFAKQCEHYVKTAQEFEAEFVLFPEFFTTQLLSIRDEQGQSLTIQDLPSFTEKYHARFSQLAQKTGMHIIGGTHFIEREESFYNVAIYFIQMVGLQGKRSFIVRRLKCMNGICIKVIS